MRMKNRLNQANAIFLILLIIFSPFSFAQEESSDNPAPSQPQTESQITPEQAFDNTPTPENFNKLPNPTAVDLARVQNPTLENFQHLPADQQGIYLSSQNHYKQEFADKYWSDAANWGANGQADKIFFSQKTGLRDLLRKGIDQKNAAQQYFRRTFNAPYIFSDAADDFFFDSEKVILKNGLTSLALSDFQNDASITGIKSTEKGFEISRRTTIPGTEEVPEEEQIQKVSVGGTEAKSLGYDRNTGTYTFQLPDGKKQQFEIPNDADVSFTFDAGKLVIEGPASGIVNIENDYAQFRNHEGTLIINQNGNINAEDGEVITSRLFLDGRFEKEGNTIRAWDVGKGGRQTVIVDKSACPEEGGCIGVATQGQWDARYLPANLKNQASALKINLDKISPASSFFVDPNKPKPTEENKAEQLRQQARQLRKPSQPPLQGKNAEVWINKDKDTNAITVTSKGVVEVGLYDARGDSAKPVPNKFRYNGLNGLSELDAQFAARTEKNVRGPAELRDDQFREGIFNNQDGAVVKITHDNFRPDQPDVIRANCFDCSQGEAIVIKKTVAIAAATEIEGVFARSDKASVRLVVDVDAQGQVSFTPDRQDLGYLASHIPQEGKQVSTGRNLLVSVPCGSDECNFRLSRDPQTGESGAAYEIIDPARPETPKKRIEYSLSAGKLLGNEAILVSEQNAAEVNRLSSLMEAGQYSRLSTLSFDKDDPAYASLKKKFLLESGLNLDAISDPSYARDVQTIITTTQRARQTLEKYGIKLDAFGRPKTKEDAQKLQAIINKGLGADVDEVTRAQWDLARMRVKEVDSLLAACQGTSYCPVSEKELKSAKEEERKVLRTRTANYNRWKVLVRKAELDRLKKEAEERAKQKDKGIDPTDKKEIVDTKRKIDNGERRKVDLRRVIEAQNDRRNAYASELEGWLRGRKSASSLAGIDWQKFSSNPKYVLDTLKILKVADEGEAQRRFANYQFEADNVKDTQKKISTLDKNLAAWESQNQALITKYRWEGKDDVAAETALLAGRYDEVNDILSGPSIAAQEGITEVVKLEQDKQGNVVVAERTDVSVLAGQSVVPAGLAKDIAARAQAEQAEESLDMAALLFDYGYGNEAGEKLQSVEASNPDAASLPSYTKVKKAKENYAQRVLEHRKKELERVNHLNRLRVEEENLGAGREVANAWKNVKVSGNFLDAVADTVALAGHSAMFLFDSSEKSAADALGITGIREGLDEQGFKEQNRQLGQISDLVKKLEDYQSKGLSPEQAFADARAGIVRDADGKVVSSSADNQISVRDEPAAALLEFDLTRKVFSDEDKRMMESMSPAERQVFAKQRQQQYEQEKKELEFDLATRNAENAQNFNRGKLAGEPAALYREAVAICPNCAGAKNVQNQLDTLKENVLGGIFGETIGGGLEKIGITYTRETEETFRDMAISTFDALAVFDIAEVVIGGPLALADTFAKLRKISKTIDAAGTAIDAYRYASKGSREAFAAAKKAERAADAADAASSAATAARNLASKAKEALEAEIKAGMEASKYQKFKKALNTPLGGFDRDVVKARNVEVENLAASTAGLKNVERDLMLARQSGDTAAEGNALVRISDSREAIQRSTQNIDKFDGLLSASQIAGSQGVVGRIWDSTFGKVFGKRSDEVIAAEENFRRAADDFAEAGRNARLLGDTEEAILSRARLDKARWNIEVAAEKVNEAHLNRKIEIYELAIKKTIQQSRREGVEGRTDELLDSIGDGGIDKIDNLLGNQNVRLVEDGDGLRFAAVEETPEIVARELDLDEANKILRMADEATGRTPNGALTIEARAKGEVESMVLGDLANSEFVAANDNKIRRLEAVGADVQRTREEPFDVVDDVVFDPCNIAAAAVYGFGVRIPCPPVQKRTQVFLVTSEISKDPGLVRLAKDAARDQVVQRDLDKLGRELAKGNLEAGLGKPGRIEGTDVSYLRSHNGARLYYRRIGADQYEIVGKSAKGRNQDQVIKRLTGLHEKQSSGVSGAIKGCAVSPGVVVGAACGIDAPETLPSPRFEGVPKTADDLRFEAQEHRAAAGTYHDLADEARQAGNADEARRAERFAERSEKLAVKAEGESVVQGYKEQAKNYRDLAKREEITGNVAEASKYERYAEDVERQAARAQEDLDRVLYPEEIPPTERTPVVSAEIPTGEEPVTRVPAEILTLPLSSVQAVSPRGPTTLNLVPGEDKYNTLLDVAATHPGTRLSPESRQKLESLDDILLGAGSEGRVYAVPDSGRQQIAKDLGVDIGEDLVMKIKDAKSSTIAELSTPFDEQAEILNRLAERGHAPRVYASGSDYYIAGKVEGPSLKDAVYQRLTPEQKKTVLALEGLTPEGTRIIKYAPEGTVMIRSEEQLLKDIAERQKIIAQAFADDPGKYADLDRKMNDLVNALREENIEIVDLHWENVRCSDQDCAKLMVIDAGFSLKKPYSRMSDQEFAKQHGFKALTGGNKDIGFRADDLIEQSLARGKAPPTLVDELPGSIIPEPNTRVSEGILEEGVTRVPDRRVDAADPQIVRSNKQILGEAADDPKVAEALENLPIPLNCKVGVVGRAVGDCPKTVTVTTAAQKEAAKKINRVLGERGKAPIEIVEMPKAEVSGVRLKEPEMFDIGKQEPRFFESEPLSLERRVETPGEIQREIDTLKEAVGRQNIDLGSIVEGYPSVDISFKSKLGSGTVGDVYEVDIPGVGEGLAAKTAKANPRRGNLEDNIWGLTREWENAQEVCQLVPCPEYHGIFVADDIPYLVQDKIIGRHHFDLTDEEILRLLTPQKEQQLKADLSRLIESSYNPGDVQMIWLTEPQTLGGKLYQPGDYVFVDVADFRRTGDLTDAQKQLLLDKHLLNKVTFPQEDAVKAIQFRRDFLPPAEIIDSATKEELRAALGSLGYEITDGGLNFIWSGDKRLRGMYTFGIDPLEVSLKIPEARNSLEPIFELAGKKFRYDHVVEDLVQIEEKGRIAKFFGINEPKITVVTDSQTRNILGKAREQAGLSKAIPADVSVSNLPHGCGAVGGAIVGAGCRLPVIPEPRVPEEITITPEAIYRGKDAKSRDAFLLEGEEYYETAEGGLKRRSILLDSTMNKNENPEIFAAIENAKIEEGLSRRVENVIPEWREAVSRQNLETIKQQTAKLQDAVTIGEGKFYTTRKGRFLFIPRDEAVDGIQTFKYTPDGSFKIEITNPTNGEPIVSHYYKIVGDEMEIDFTFVAPNYQGYGVNRRIMLQTSELHPDVEYVRGYLTGTNKDPYVDYLRNNPGATPVDAIKETPAYKIMESAGWELDVERSVLPTLDEVEEGAGLTLVSRKKGSGEQSSQVQAREIFTREAVQLAGKTPEELQGAFYNIYNHKTPSAVVEEGKVNHFQEAFGLRNKIGLENVDVDPGMIQSGWVGLGSTDELQHGNEVRYYFNSKNFDSSKAVLEKVASELGNQKIPFKIKANRNKAVFTGRTDNTVLYVDAAHRKQVEEVITQLDPALLDEEVSLFTKKVSKGVSWAESPGNIFYKGMTPLQKKELNQYGVNAPSFGTKRSEALAEIYSVTGGKVGPEFDEISREIFKKHGIDLDQPWLNLDSPLKELPAPRESSAQVIRQVTSTEVPIPAEVLEQQLTSPVKHLGNGVLEYNNKRYTYDVGTGQWKQQRRILWDKKVTDEDITAILDEEWSRRLEEGSLSISDAGLKPCNIGGGAIVGLADCLPVIKIAEEVPEQPASQLLKKLDGLEREKSRTGFSSSVEDLRRQEEIQKNIETVERELLSRADRLERSKFTEGIDNLVLSESKPLLTMDDLKERSNIFARSVRGSGYSDEEVILLAFKYKKALQEKGVIKDYYYETAMFNIVASVPNHLPDYRLSIEAKNGLLDFVGAIDKRFPQDVQKVHLGTDGIEYLDYAYRLTTDNPSPNSVAHYISRKKLATKSELERIVLEGPSLGESLGSGEIRLYKDVDVAISSATFNVYKTSPDKRLVFEQSLTKSFDEKVMAVPENRDRVIELVADMLGEVDPDKPIVLIDLAGRAHVQPFVLKMGTGWLGKAENWKYLSSSQKERLMKVLSTETEAVAQQKLSKVKIDYHLGVSDQASPFWNKDIHGIYQTEQDDSDGIALAVEEYKGIEISDQSLLAGKIEFKPTEEKSITFVQKLIIADEVNKRKAAARISSAEVLEDLSSLPPCPIGGALVGRAGSIGCVVPSSTETVEVVFEKNALKISEGADKGEYVYDVATDTFSRKRWYWADKKLDSVEEVETIARLEEARVQKVIRPKTVDDFEKGSFIVIRKPESYFPDTVWIDIGRMKVEKYGEEDILMDIKAGFSIRKSKGDLDFMYGKYEAVVPLRRSEVEKFIIEGDFLRLKSADGVHLGRFDGFTKEGHLKFTDINGKELTFDYKKADDYLSIISAGDNIVIKVKPVESYRGSYVSEINGKYIKEDETTLTLWTRDGLVRLDKDSLQMETLERIAVEEVEEVSSVVPGSTIDNIITAPKITTVENPEIKVIGTKRIYYKGGLPIKDGKALEVSLDFGAGTKGKNVLRKGRNNIQLDITNLDPADLAAVENRVIKELEKQGFALRQEDLLSLVDGFKKFYPEKFKSIKELAQARGLDDLQKGRNFLRIREGASPTDTVVDSGVFEQIIDKSKGKISAKDAFHTNSNLIESSGGGFLGDYHSPYLMDQETEIDNFLNMQSKAGGRFTNERLIVEGDFVRIEVSEGDVRFGVFKRVEGSDTVLADDIGEFRVEKLGFFNADEKFLERYKNMITNGDEVAVKMDMTKIPEIYRSEVFSEVRGKYIWEDANTLTLYNHGQEIKLDKDSLQMETLRRLTAEEIASSKQPSNIRVEIPEQAGARIEGTGARVDISDEAAEVEADAFDEAVNKEAAQVRT